MSDDTSSYAEDSVRRVTAGSLAPHVPFLTPVDGADLGLAGSLIQARVRARQLRAAARAAHPRGRQLLLAGAGAALLLLGAAAWTSRTGLRQGGVVRVLAAVALLAAVAAGAWRRYRPSAGERDLSAQIARERRTATALESLGGAGWSVLHDRLVPGTEHRLAHVLVGPAGVVVATEVTLAGPPALRAGVLHTGEVALGEWFTTRWWEADHIHAALVVQLATWPWTGPVYPLAVVGDDRRSRALTTGRSRRPRRRRVPPAGGAPTPVPAFPLAHARVAIRTTRQACTWVAALPAPLGRLAAASLAAEVAAACQPAAVRAVHTPAG